MKSTPPNGGTSVSIQAFSLSLSITLDRSDLMGYKTGESSNIEPDFGALRYGKTNHTKEEAQGGR